jgi:hypothetical protein
MSKTDKASDTPRWKWTFEHVLIPFILAILVVIGLPWTVYKLDLGGQRTRDYDMSISRLDQEIQRGEERCGTTIGIKSLLEEAKKHRGNAIDALYIEHNLEKVDKEIREAQSCLREARELGCPEIHVPSSNDSPWW